MASGGWGWNWGSGGWGSSQWEPSYWSEGYKSKGKSKGKGKGKDESTGKGKDQFSDTYQEPWMEQPQSSREFRLDLERILTEVPASSSNSPAVESLANLLVRAMSAQETPTAPPVAVPPAAVPAAIFAALPAASSSKIPAAISNQLPSPDRIKISPGLCEPPWGPGPPPHVRDMSAIERDQLPVRPVYDEDSGDDNPWGELEQSEGPAASKKRRD